MVVLNTNIANTRNNTNINKTYTEKYIKYQQNLYRKVYKISTKLILESIKNIQQNLHHRSDISDINNDLQTEQ